MVVVVVVGWGGGGGWSCHKIFWENIFIAFLHELWKNKICDVKKIFSQKLFFPSCFFTIRAKMQ